MKFVKNAFTLAEVLVVLAILGVVAAITMPALHTDTRKSAVGPSLAKAISTLENANELLLADTGARSLRDRCGDETNDYIACLSSNIKVIQNNNFNGNYTKYDGTPLDLSSMFIGAHVGSDNIEYISVKDNERVNNLLQSRLPSLSNEYSGQCYVVFVDINGSNKGPNTLGRDLFRLFVDGKGSVIPDGGSKAEAYFGDGAVTRGCDPNRVTDGGYSCAGSIVDNGYRVVYPY